LFVKSARLCDLILRRMDIFVKAAVFVLSVNAIEIC